jgi:hypothetical protein
LASPRVDLVVVVVVVVDLDGDGDVEVDATVDAPPKAAADAFDMLSFQRLDVYQPTSHRALLLML